MDSKHGYKVNVLSLLQGIVWEHTWFHGGDPDNRRHTPGGKKLLQAEHNKCRSPGTQ